MSVAEREAARRGNGQFGEQHHTSPEVTVATASGFAEPLDVVGHRPLRPYLPLTDGDDDEVFDSPIGTSIRMKTPAGDRLFVRVGEDQWQERNQLRTSVVISEMSTGHVWQAMFGPNHAVHPAQLSAPYGALYSDRHFFVAAHQIDKPLTKSEALRRVSATGKAQMVSRSMFGDDREDGIPKDLQGPLTVTTTTTNDVVFTGVGTRPAERKIPASSVKTFDRDGDIVFRRETTLGYGWEEVFRPVR